MGGHSLMLPTKDPVSWQEHVNALQRISDLEGRLDAITEERDRERALRSVDAAEVDRRLTRLEANIKFHRSWWDNVILWWRSA